MYLATDEVSVFVAVDLLVVLEHTVTGASAHEVVVALTRREAAAHGGTCLIAALASLKGNHTHTHNTGGVSGSPTGPTARLTRPKEQVTVTDHEPSPRHGTVNVQERAVVLLKHLS